MKKKIYQNPVTQAVEMYPTGILCGSGGTNTFMNQNDIGVNNVWGN